MAALDELKETLKEVISQTRPNFFRIGFYMYKNPDAKLDPAGRSIEEINDMALSYLNENFMSEFIELERKGVSVDRPSGDGEGQRRLYLRHGLKARDRQLFLL